MARVDDAALSRGYVKTRPPMDRVSERLFLRRGGEILAEEEELHFVVGDAAFVKARGHARGAP